MKTRTKVTFYDRKSETLARKELEKFQERRLRKLFEPVLASNAFYRRKLRDFHLKYKITLLPHKFGRAHYPVLTMLQ